MKYLYFNNWSKYDFGEVEYIISDILKNEGEFDISCEVLSFMNNRWANKSSLLKEDKLILSYNE